MKQAQSNTSIMYRIGVVLVIISLLYYPVFTYIALFAPDGEILQYPWWNRALHVLVLSPVTIALGLFIMRRVPGNIIGPALIVFQILGNGEVIFALPQPVVQSSLNVFIISVASFPALIIILSHFPSGHIYPRRITPIVYALIGTMVLVGFLQLFVAPHAYGTEFAYGEARANPFFIDGLQPILNPIIQWSSGLSGLIIPATIFLQAYRYRHANSTERRQMRWLFFGMLLTLIPILLNLISFNVFGEEHPLSVFFINLAFTGVKGVIPIAIGFGVLFNRLWDIDVIIRRTLIYSVVSLLLAVTYFGIVLTAQTVLSGFVPDNNAPLIVISTLIVAGFFNPVLQRVQAIIDRIFYRKRYDAEATLQQFSTSIRDAVEPTAIQQEMLDTVTSTLQPQTISLWVVQDSKVQKDISI